VEGERRKEGREGYDGKDRKGREEREGLNGKRLAGREKEREVGKTEKGK
jgi:hypothetical protein